VFVKVDQGAKERESAHGVLVDAGQLSQASATSSRTNGEQPPASKH